MRCSVWDALTDNYISTWDGKDPEGLNGNLSDQEVLTHCPLDLQLASSARGSRDLSLFVLKKCE